MMPLKFGQKKNQLNVTPPKNNLKIKPSMTAQLANWTIKIIEN